MSNTHRCIIPPAGKVQLARDLCRTVAGLPGDGMFLSPVTTDGTTVSDYISAGMINQDFADLLPLHVDQHGEPVGLPGNAALVAQLAGQAEEPLIVTTEEVQALFDTCDVSEQEPFDALARLGRSLYQEPEA